MKPRVLLIACDGLGSGGIQAVIMSIVRNLSHKYIFDVVVFTNEKGRHEEEFLSYGGSIYRVPYYFGKNVIKRKLDYFGRNIYTYPAILKIIEKNGPYCAIHCHNYYLSALCLKAADKKGIPVRISHVHDVMHTTVKIEKHIRKYLLKMINQYATHKLGCSEAACVSMFGKNSNAKVALNPYDSNHFDIKKYAQGRDEDLTLIQVGSYSEKKNQIFSIHVLKHVQKFFPGAKLFFLGFDNGNYLVRMKSEIERLHLEHSIVFFPHDADSAELLSRSHIALVPSLFEGFGIVAVEAQAMGVHCFASDDLPTITDAGGCSYLPLSLGEEEWANRIVEWYKKNKGVPQVYDCSRFSGKETAKQYDVIYGGK